MVQPTDVLAPSPGERGLATSDPSRLAASVSRSWELFAAMVAPLDLDAVTRAKGLTVREVVIPLGAWDDNRPVAAVLDEVRRGVVGDHDQGALVDAVRESHRHESDEAIHEALRRQGQEMSAFLHGDLAEEYGASPVASMLGTLPVLTFLHASTYPLATSALDLEVAGAQVPQELLENGLLGLVDTIGALAARQLLRASLLAVTPTSTVGTGAVDGSWRTRALDAPAEGGSGRWPTVRGSTRMLLEVTSGRADVPTAIRRRELGADDWQGLLALAPIVERVPGIPGRSALIAALRATRGIARAAGALSSALHTLPFRRP